MFELIDKIRKEASGQRALSFVREIILFHRIQASPGYRKAATRVMEILKDHGLDVKILSFKAKDGNAFWGHPSFEEWSPKNGRLFVKVNNDWLKFADFEDEPVSLVPRSKSFQGKVEIVAVENGERMEDYKGIDVKGRVVLTKGNIERVRDLAVQRLGAIGILRDNISSIAGEREAFDLPDARQYVSFWGYGKEKRAFGFSLTPRQGEKLRKYYSKENKPLEGKVEIDTSFYEGNFEVVEAYIPGSDLEAPEVLLVAHLCHPKPFANDNASGSASLIETAIILKNLQEKGKLSLKRGIRFIWVPEMTGTMAYLSHFKGKRKFICGLNLDMVGENQALTGSTLLLIGTPDSAPGFPDSLLSHLVDVLFREGKGFSGNAHYPLFRVRETPFMGGSDHYILSDPTVGIPTPMLNQWPDKFYHTTFDTPDKTDPEMLKRVSILASVYSAFLSMVDSRDEVDWLAWLSLSSLKKRLDKSLEEFLSPFQKKEGELGPFKDEASLIMAKSIHLFERFKREMNSLKALGEVSEDYFLKEGEKILREFQRGLNRFNIGCDEIRYRKRSEIEDMAGRMKFRRKWKGPIFPSPYVRKLREDDRDRWHEIGERAGLKAHLLSILTLFWSTHKENLYNAMEEAFLESGLWDPQFLVEHFEFLKKMGLLENFGVRS